MAVRTRSDDRAASVAGAPALFEAIREPLAATGKIKPKRLETLLNAAASAFKQYGKRVSRVAAGKPRDFSLGRERFEMFVAQVGKRVASGVRLVAEVLDQVSTSKPDLFTRQLEEGAPLGQPIVDRKGSHAGDAGSARPGRSPARREEVGHV